MVMVPASSLRSQKQVSFGTAGYDPGQAGMVTGRKILAKSSTALM